MQDYNRVADLLEDLYQIIENYKAGMTIGGKPLDKEGAIDILEDIRNNLPRELKEASNILKNGQKIIKDAHDEAQRIIKAAEEKADFISSEHEIIKIAEQKAQIAKKEAAEYYLSMKSASINYANSSMLACEEALQASLKSISAIFKSLEESFSKEIDAIYADRQAIREYEDKFAVEIEEILRNK